MSVATGPVQAAFCATFVDELLRAGVTDAVVSPGSRSTPLALAIAESDLRLHVRLDERSACFVALGLARATERPVLVLVTSGTAVAELLAGVVEAHLDRVPLIVATADRPPELHGIGAAQTIDQQGIFGPHVLGAIDPGPVHALPPSSWRPLASRLVVLATGGPAPGPVVVNLPFVEPLVAEPGALPPGRTAGRPWFSLQRSTGVEGAPVELPHGRGVIVAGGGAGPPSELLAAAGRLGWPILADPRSGCRTEHPSVITVADTVLRDPQLAATLAPDVIVVAGAPPASKVVGEWVESTADAGAELVLLGAHALSRHPSQRAAVLLDGRSEDLWPRIARGAAPMDRSWRDTWVAVQQAVEATFAEQLGGAAWNEPAVVRAIAQIDQPIVIVASSSMPLRDLEWYGGTRPVAHPTHANRGANGIDGVVSTAVGVSLGEDRPVVAVVGDLAFLHDVSALVEGLGDESRASSLTVVVLDNGGGGIFSFLPQRNAVHGETFRRLFVTARSPRPAEVAGGFGIPAAVVGSLDELRRAMPARLARNGIEVVVCELPDHDANVATHDRVVASALEAARSVVLPAR